MHLKILLYHFYFGKRFFLHIMWIKDHLNGSKLIHSPLITLLLKLESSKQAQKEWKEGRCETRYSYLNHQQIA